MNAEERNERRRRVLEVQAIYRQVDRAYAPFSCPGTAECCNPKKTGLVPYLWPAEWEGVEEHLERSGRALPEPRADGGCPFLDAAGKRCTIYAARPLGCRTYFCHRRKGPEEEPSDVLAELSERLASLNVAHDPSATPQSIVAWFEAARSRA